MLEENFHLGCHQVRWGRVLFYFGLFSALAILSSCGAKPATTTGPTITASCTPSQGTGADVTVLGTAQCLATVLNASSTLVNWSVSGTGNGSITSTGLYTAPPAVPTNNVVTITATSQVQSSLTANATLTIVAATAINAITCVDPNSTSGQNATMVSSGNSLNCTATTTTGAVVPATWTVTNANNLGGNVGTISPQGGNYVAPLVPPPGQSVTITATTANALSKMSVKVTVVFGNNVLHDNYVFSVSGRLTNSSKAFWARTGSFSVGGGTLRGTEDTNQGGSPNTVTTQRAFTGSYSIGPDGRGTMQFCENPSSSCPLGSLSATAFFRIVVVSLTQAQIVEFSSPTATSATTTAGGEMISQDPSVFGAGNANLSGTYSFNFAGVSSSGSEHSIVGEFTADGHGTIGSTPPAPPVPGEMDIDDSSSPTPLPATTYSIGGNGLGAVTLGGLTFDIYPVSANRAKFIEIDPVPPSTAPSSVLLGDAYLQQTSSTCGWGMNALSGTTVFETMGMVTAGASSGFVIADIGNFTADGTVGAVTAASIDENSGGTYAPPAGALSGSYAVDACGRGTLAIGTHTYVFYIIATSDAVLQETTAANGVIAHGVLMPSQGGPFADAILTGSYAFRAGGTDAAGTAGLREDFLGQFTSSGTGTGLAGTLDLNDHGATQTGLAIGNGMYTAAGGLRGTLSLPVATSPATTRNFVLYMVSPTLFYILETDPTGTALGVMNNQF